MPRSVVHGHCQAEVSWNQRLFPSRCPFRAASARILAPNDQYRTKDAIICFRIAVEESGGGPAHAPDLSARSVGFCNIAEVGIMAESITSSRPRTPRVFHRFGRWPFSTALAGARIDGKSD